MRNENWRLLGVIFGSSMLCSCVGAFMAVAIFSSPHSSQPVDTTKPKAYHEPTDAELEEFIAKPPVIEMGPPYLADHEFYLKVKEGAK